MKTLISSINRIDQILALLLLPLVVILSLAVAGLMVTGIFTRSVLGSPLLGLEEVILLAVMWVYMVGAALASRDRTHLRADFVNVFVTDDVLRNRLHTVAHLISTVMVIAFAIWSLDLLMWGLDKRQATTALQIPLFLAQGSMFFASVLMLFYVLRDLLLTVSGEGADS